MKTPIVYYGGKSNMLKEINQIIGDLGEYRTYCEPFVGGGAVLFNLPKAKVEVINDNLDMVVNFYHVAQNDFEQLRELVKNSLHSETQFKKSSVILKNPGEFSNLQRAWAFWFHCRVAFAHKMFGGFGFAKTANLAITTANKIDQFDNDIFERVRHLQIFNRDALDVILKFDDAKTFFYLDPPYPNSDCGHYSKGKDVYYDLLNILPKLKGKFLLSSYPCNALDIVWNLPNIKHKCIDKNLAVSAYNKGKRKTETLTWNF